MARRRDRLSILDMSTEDDSLLPKTVCTVVKEEDEEDDDSVKKVEEVEEADPGMIPLHEFRAPRRRKKCGHASLRKSLAWDKAFLTGEGVLEPDELPIPAARSPKKLPELPTLEMNSKAPEDNEAAVPVVAAEAEENKAGLSNLRSCSERFDYRSVACSVQSLSVEPPPASVSSASSVPVKHPATSVPRSLPPKKVIESAIQKGTRLRLPSAVTTAEQKHIPLPPRQLKESNLSKKVTLVSRKVKDTIGRVLPGRVDSVQKSVNIRASNLTLPDVKGEPIDTSCSWDASSVSDATEDTGDVSSKKQEQSFLRSYSTGSRLKFNPTDEMRTGLRVPSPKLGFFDSKRALPQSFKSSTVAASSGVPNPVKAVRVRPQGLPKGKPRQTPSTALPSAPPLQNSCNSAPTTPRKSTNDLLSPGARVAASSSSLTPKSKAVLTRGSFSKSFRKLGMDHVAVRSSEADQEKLSGEQTGQTSSKDFSADASLDTAETAAKLSKQQPEVLATDTHAKAPLAVNSGLLNSGSNVFKEKGSFFAFARKAVGLLSSPVHEKENSASAESKIAAAVKTGPVQHSPPNKASPQRGPWSPVKKHGTAQLGPFDCTKSNAPTVEWEGA